MLGRGLNLSCLWQDSVVGYYEHSDEHTYFIMITIINCLLTCSDLRVRRIDPSASLVADPPLSLSLCAFRMTVKQLPRNLTGWNS
jgi:hypothetical protein